MSAQAVVRRLTGTVAVLVALAGPARAQDAPAPPPLPSEPLFNPEVIQRIDLWMHSLDWEKLKQDFQENTYYPADFTWNGQTVHNIGIRSRGRGSRSGTKPGLRVDFDRYTLQQEFLGLKSLVLDNLTQDPSGIHETVAMRLFARLGIPAPRETFARLYIRGNYIGLYAVVESIDKRFLARTFGSIGDDVQNDGYLYEFDYTDVWNFSYLGSALEPYMARFDPKTHESKSNAEKYGPIENLVRLVNELPAEQYMSTLNEHLDLHAFIRYVAAQNFVGQNDGFLGYAGVNNFYLYRKENSASHVFLAWDEDNAFWGPDFPIAMRHQENVLMNKAMQVPELNAAYHAVLAQAVASASELTGPGNLPWLEYEIRRQCDLIYDAFREDTSKPYSNDDHDNACVAMILFARGRPGFVASELSAVPARRGP